MNRPRSGLCNNAVSTSANRLKKPVRQVLKSGQVVSGMKRNKEYNAWRRVAMQEILAQRPALAVKTLGPGWYNLSLRLAMQDPAGIDNREKSVADVLVAMGATPDDRWMHSKDTQRSKEVPLGKCVVTVSQVFGAEKI